MLLDIKSVNPVNNRNRMDNHNSVIRRYWAKASTTAVYLENRLPHSVAKGMTPYEALYKSKPKISHLQPFGKDCYVHIPEERRPPGSKLLPCAEKGIFFGYTNSHSIYKIHIPSRKHTMTINIRDVEFHRHRHPRPQLSTESTPMISSNPITPMISSNSITSTPFNPRPQLRHLDVYMPAPPLNRDQYINDTDIISDDVSLSHSIWSRHLIRPPEPIRLLESIDDIHEEVLGASTTSDVDNEPQSYKQAMKSPDSHRWILAIQQELDTLHYNNTWSIVPLPRSDRNIVGSKWIYKIKRDANGDIAHYKARLLAQGFSQ